ncbi:1-deoxyxylulose-5-phosphate synthase YajO [Brevundimonas sp. NIBR10]|nr:1-deoxyxylulose-5-phosphate synthase YajO [Brevundimonas sp. NIBR10]
MQYRVLGRTGVFVSRICLGTMTFGGRDMPPYDKVGGLDQGESQAIIDAALDAGVNFIDTANVYAGGESETIVGNAIKGRRDDIVLATKFHARMGPGPNDTGLSRLHMMNAIEASLKRLQTDRIDLYQLHSLDPLTPVDVTLRALDDVVRQGKVRMIGCSNLAAWQIMKALGISSAAGLEPFASVQAYYSLAGRDLEHELAPMIEDQGLGLMVWSPLAGGFLSGKYGRRVEQGVSRRDKVEFPPIDREKAYDIIEALTLVGEAHGVSAAQVALAWLLDKDVVTSVIVGARRLDQINDNIAALSLTLSAEELAALDRVSDTGPHYPGWLHAFAGHGRAP